MEIFFQVIIPVLLVVIAGYAYQKYKKIDVKPLSNIVVNLLITCMVFRTFYNLEFNMQYVSIIIFSLLLFTILVIITELYSSYSKYKPSIKNSLILSVCFMNSGNYGAPITLLAFGRVAFNYAISLMVLHAIMLNTLGVYFAARGTYSIKDAFKSIFKIPILYAAAVAVIMQLLDIKMPSNIMTMLDSLADSAIPMIMLIFGIQLADIKIQDLNFKILTFGILARLIISPIIAVLLLIFIEVDPLLRNVLILSSAMPSATLAVIFAIEFDSAPEVISSITFITTIISIITITVLLYIL